MYRKEKYLQTFRNNKDRLDEISFGKAIGFNEDTSRKILSRLLIGT